jgi:hypothetical protein
MCHGTRFTPRQSERRSNEIIVLRLHHVAEKLFKRGMVAIDNSKQKAEQKEEVALLAAAVQHSLLVDTTCLDVHVGSAHVDLEQGFALHIRRPMQASKH